MEKKRSRIGFYVIALSAIFIIAVFLFPTVAFAESNLQRDRAEALSFKQESVESFLMENQTVGHEYTVSDFSNNIFVVYELLPKGHAIYSVTENASIFLEGSYEVASPYYGHYQHEVYYVGPGDYYCVEDSVILNLITYEVVNYNDIPHTYQINTEFYLENRDSIQPKASFPSTPDPNKTRSADGFTVINDDSYFRNLTVFPDNTVGTCGLVLFNTCMHTILGIGGDNGYPMAGYEIRETMKDYLITNALLRYVTK